MKMPSQEEQTIAEDYVLNRPLFRPDTDARKAVKYVIVYALASIIIGFSALFLFERFGIFLLLSESILEFKNMHPIAFNTLFIILIFILTGICCLKAAVIGCIRLYQHYAPEQIRRRCLFKPTCSEYAILAIKKYGLIIGLIKAYIRLFRKCRGNIYRIDYP